MMPSGAGDTICDKGNRALHPRFTARSPKCTRVRPLRGLRRARHLPRGLFPTRAPVSARDKNTGTFLERLISMRLRLIAAIGAAVMGFALLSTPASADGRYGDRSDRHGSYSHRGDDCRDHRHRHTGTRGHQRRQADNRGWRRGDGDRHRGNRYDRNDRRWNDRNHRHRDNDRGRRGRDRDRDGWRDR